MQRGIKSEPLLDDGDEDIGGHRDPDLGFDCVLRGTVEAFDAKVLLDPLEEQLHLPAAAIQRADRERGQPEVVGEEHELFAGLG